MQPARPESLAFLAPGLLHHLGNVLFTIQGNAQAFGPVDGAVSRELAAVLAAVERGSHALRVLRGLLGDPAAPQVDARSLLEQLADLLRVPVREARQSFELRQSARPLSVLVDPSEFCRTVVDLLHGLVAILPNGVHGTVVLDLFDQGEGHVTVRVAFQPPAGSLPFPIAVDDVRQRLQQDLQRSRSAARVSCHGMALDVVFGGRCVTRAAEA